MFALKYSSLGGGGGLEMGGREINEKVSKILIILLKLGDKYMGFTLPFSLLLYVFAFPYTKKFERCHGKSVLSCLFIWSPINYIPSN